MSYMSRNVNFILLLLIITMLAYIMGLTNYYENTYKNLSVTYRSEVEQLNSITENLSLHRSQLNKTYSELQLRVADKTKFDQMYTELTNVKNQLETDLSSTRSDLAETKADLKDTNNQLLQVQSQLRSAQIEISTKQTTITSLNDRIDSLESQLASCNARCPP